MLAYSIRELTLYDFDNFERAGYGDLLDPARFCEVLKSPLKVARLTFLAATFEGVRPSEAEFMGSIRAEDFATLRFNLTEAYRDFFRAPEPERTTGGEKETTGVPIETKNAKESPVESGGIER